MARAVECVAPLVLADLPREEMLSRALKQAGHSMLPAAVQPLVEVSEGPALESITPQRPMTASAAPHYHTCLVRLGRSMPRQGSPWQPSARCRSWPRTPPGLPL